MDGVWRRADVAGPVEDAETFTLFSTGYFEYSQAHVREDGSKITRGYNGEWEKVGGELWMKLLHPWTSADGLCYEMPDHEIHFEFTLVTEQTKSALTFEGGSKPLYFARRLELQTVSSKSQRVVPTEWAFQLPVMSKAVFVADIVVFPIDSDASDVE